MKKYFVVIVLAGTLFLAGSLPAEESSDLERSLKGLFKSILQGTEKEETPSRTGESAKPETATSESGKREILYTQDLVNELFITGRFQIILGRRPTGNELSGFKQRLARDLLSEEELIASLFNSSEASSRNRDNNAFITTLFRALFDREPRRAEFNRYGELLARGAKTRFQLREWLIQLSEFKAGAIARKTLAKHGTVESVFRESPPKLHKKARDIASRIISEKGKDNYRIRASIEGLLALADKGREVQQSVVSGSGDAAYYALRGEEIRYLLYIIDRNFGYSSELDFVGRQWSKTVQEGILLLKLMSYLSEDQPESAAVPSQVEQDYTRNIRLTLVKGSQVRISNPIDLNSGTAKKIAQFVLDNFDSYSAQQKMSLMEEFQLERLLRQIADGRGAPRNIRIAKTAPGRYTVYFYTEL